MIRQLTRRCFFCQGSESYNRLLGKYSDNMIFEKAWSQIVEEFKPKTAKIQKLIANEQINNYFKDKSSKNLQKEDLVFYIEHEEFFSKMPLMKRKVLIFDLHADLKFKILLSKKFKISISDDDQLSEYFIATFNESIYTQPIEDLLFCLQVFQPQKKAQKRLNFHDLEKILTTTDLKVNHFVELVYYMSILGHKFITVTKATLEDKLQKLAEWSLKNIFYLNKIRNLLCLNFKPSFSIQLKTAILMKTRNFENGQDYLIVQLLSEYPEIAGLIKIEDLSPGSYASYLGFFAEKVNDPGAPKVHPHQIPKSIIESPLFKLEVYRNYFDEIISNRMALGLDNFESIGKLFPRLLTKDLQIFLAAVRFLKRYEGHYPTEIWFELQTCVCEILQLNQKHPPQISLKALEKIFTKYDQMAIFDLLGVMSRGKIGSISFWKKALKFVSDTLAHKQQLFQDLTIDQLKIIVVRLFKIYLNKPLPQHIQETIINMAISSMNSVWYISQISQLTKMLSLSGIGHNQLWIAIEKQVIKNQITTKNRLDSLKRVAINFNSIGKGSYDFWNFVDSTLSDEDKRVILNSYKIPSTLAHSYFTFKSAKKALIV